MTRDNDVSTASCNKLPYPFFLFGGDEAELCCDPIATGVRCSSIDPRLDLEGVLGRSNDLLNKLPADSLLMRGDGNGVISVIAAKYGDASTDAVLGETDEAILDVERADRRELPKMGIIVGEARWCCIKPASEVTGVSKKVGVSFKNGAVAGGGRRMFVFMDSPADAGVDDFGLE